jgi:hypothetical protein
MVIGYQLSADGKSDGVILDLVLSFSPHALPAPLGASGRAAAVTPYLFTRSFL